ncbi:MAG: SDR family NAD(P)-dependent oxidoreductase [Rhodothermales bacterium]
MELRNKAAIVTGASAGIGLAFSRHLVGRGAIVYGLARTSSRLDEARVAMGETFRPVVCDVSDEEHVSAAVERVVNDAGRIDVLINNAGLGKYGRVDELSLEDWDIQMNTNLRGIFLCTRAVVPHMRRQNRESGFGGHIINVASIAGLLGNPTLSAYNATKFGVRGFSEAVMKEVREDGIKVSCIYPGSIATNFSAISGGGGSPNPMTPDDIANTVIHLLETSDNYLISEVVMRPLRPKG